MAVADDEVRPSTEEEEEGEARGADKKKRRSSVLGALREAIGKVRFLLSFSATRWVLLASSAAARGTPARRLSFDAPRPAGLLEVEGSIVAPSPASSSSSSSGSRTSRSASLGTASARSLSRTSSAASPAAQMKRASSSASGAGSSPGSASAGGDDDIDQRAEEFIANFYRQLRMERQVSLQLRYVRGNSWDRTP
ncbi:hypothetical protein U9M48_038706 [Paspalum notatum var. saurae]|uniref:Uncharacterized protein n=1 Tax=Paspalum notatum var. saurae TaxID=547442 RepID=A0AAQ3UM54_PASNO